MHPRKLGTFFPPMENPNHFVYFCMFGNINRVVTGKQRKDNIALWVNFSFLPFVTWVKTWPWFKFACILQKRLIQSSHGSSKHCFSVNCQPSIFQRKLIYMELFSSVQNPAHHVLITITKRLANS